jgi:hypothetical protein
MTHCGEGCAHTCAFREGMGSEGSSSSLVRSSWCVSQKTDLRRASKGVVAITTQLGGQTCGGLASKIGRMERMSYVKDPISPVWI